MSKIKSIGTIRAPQLVGMYGPGSIVNLERISVMPSSVNYWNAGTPTISSPTFSREIRAEKLIDCSAISSSGVPATLFPKTFVCRRCGTIQDRTSLTDRDVKVGFTCYVDGGALHPSRWIMFCVEGHIADFNYRRFLHGRSVCDRRIVLETGATLSHTYVRCECGERASMADAYKQNDGTMSCSGYAPWTSQQVACSSRPKLSMRSASDVYFGAVRSAITIEPESDPLVAKAFETLGTLTSAVQSDRVRAKSALLSTKYFEFVAEEDLDRVLDAFYLAETRPSEYKNRRLDEFGALSRDCGSPSEDLYVESVPSADLIDFGIDGLFAVRKLREVRALVGFRRGGMPADPAFDEESSNDTLALLGNEGVFPAYENRGEGVFLRFSADALREWIKRDVVSIRVDRFAESERRWRLASSGIESGRQRGFYILAHSFAHILIRQISLVSGYSQSSLRERVYASSDDHPDPWAGVLIYTASSDADGSLGGLVAQAVDRTIRALLEDAFQEMQVCSSDPICALQIPVGFRKLNGAACHGCLVLPETCCERNNNFLDRTLVVPNTVHDATKVLSFFNG